MEWRHWELIYGTTLVHFGCQLFYLIKERCYTHGRPFSVIRYHLPDGSTDHNP